MLSKGYYSSLIKKRQGVERGLVFDIKPASSDDGPGIRTVIFLKGCPLSCVWCHSPESIKQLPELVFYRDKCVLCGRCVVSCPNGAQELTNRKRTINREKCHSCGLCTQSCYPVALEIKGLYVTVGEILEEIEKDMIFYRNSGGGVTLSGGEPTFQPMFTLNILKRCKEKNISTALETNGFVEWRTLEKILGYTDLLLYDIKHMNSARHREYTGVSNELILQNLKKVIQRRKEVIIRLPIIPGYNDSESNIRQTASYLRSLDVNKVNLLSYNEMAGSKYHWIDKDFKLSHVKYPGMEKMETIREIIQSYKLNATMGSE